LGYLVEENFVQFFKDAASKNKKQKAIWQNLKNFNYRNDLKLPEEVEQPKIDVF